VLPVPGPARTSSGPDVWSTTVCCDGSRSGATEGGTGARTSRYAGRLGALRPAIGMGRSDHGRPTVRAGNTQPPANDVAEGCGCSDCAVYSALAFGDTSPAQNGI